MPWTSNRAVPFEPSLGQCDVLQYNIIQYNTIQYNTIQYNSIYTYFLLAEFEGRTVNYGPRFFPAMYGPSAKRAGHKSKGNNKGP